MTIGARILIVDDDETVLQTFKTALTLEGYDVATAATPMEGLQDAEETPPDAVLLDLRMPFVNGFGFLYRFRAQSGHLHTPVAIITGDSCFNDSSTMTRAVSTRFATTTGRSPIRILRHSWKRFRLRSPDKRCSPIPLAAQRRLVSVNVDVLRSTLRRPAAAALDMGGGTSYSVDSTWLISQSARQYCLVVLARLPA